MRGECEDTEVVEVGRGALELRQSPRNRRGTLPGSASSYPGLACCQSLVLWTALDAHSRKGVEALSQVQALRLRSLAAEAGPDFLGADLEQHSGRTPNL